MDDVTAEDVADELSLSPREVLTALALQARMLSVDLEATKAGAARTLKADRAQSLISESLAETVPDPLADWVPSELSGISELPWGEQVELLTALASALAEDVNERRAAIIILAELLTFSPWEGTGKWAKGSRTAGLDAAATDLAGLLEDDYAAMAAEFESLMKALRRKSVKWGRVAAVAIAGAGLGVVTGGLAAPAIGGAIGATMGLSGAAATSAGLAILGGGSLAAGGFGVAGGSLLLTGMGGFLFAGAAAVGTRFSPMAYRAVAADAVKLDLIVRMIFADSPDHDEKIRRVVESLQETINLLSDRTKLLVDKITALKEQKTAIEAENTSLKEQINTLKDEIEAMKSTQTTLTVVRDRLAISS